MNDWMDGGTANGVVLISHPFPPQNRGIIRFRTCDRAGTDALKKPIDWAMEETEAGASNDAAQKHLWEESWDDDDTSDDFSQQLKYVRSSQGAHMALALKSRL